MLLKIAQVPPTPLTVRSWVLGSRKPYVHRSPASSSSSVTSASLLFTREVDAMNFIRPFSSHRWVTGPKADAKQEVTESIVWHKLDNPNRAGHRIPHRQAFSLARFKSCKNTITQENVSRFKETLPKLCLYLLRPSYKTPIIYEGKRAVFYGLKQCLLPAVSFPSLGLNHMVYTGWGCFLYG